MRLLHGTCSCRAESIKRDGFRIQSYFTSCESIAEYYAECQSEECQCNTAVIIESDINGECLDADFNSYDEPLTYFRNEYANSDEEWFLLLEDGTIPYPSNQNDYGVSLSTVKSVKCNQPIPNSCIVTEV